jgi:hypothetical protein
MNTPQELTGQMAEKSDQELLDMLLNHANGTPAALDAARAEIQKRNFRVPSVGDTTQQPKQAAPSRALAAIGIVFGIVGIVLFVGGFGPDLGHMSPAMVLGTALLLSSFLLGIMARRNKK